MGIFDINNIAINAGGAGISHLELFCTVAGLLCVFLAGRNNKYNFWIGYLYNILLFMMFWQKHLYSAMLLQPLSLAINILGHWRWTHPKSGEESAAKADELKVSLLNWRERGVTAGIILAGGLIWGLVLSKLGYVWAEGTFSPDPQPYLDAFLLVLTLTAQFLSAQKKWDCWILWILVNLVNLSLYLSAGLVVMPFVSALYLLNAVWAMVTWTKLYRRNA